MGLSDHYRGGQVERMVVTIVTVDQEIGRIEGVGRDAAITSILPGTPLFFRWPSVGESWVIVRENGLWRLESLVDEMAETKTLESGVGLIQAEGIGTPSGRRFITDLWSRRTFGLGKNAASVALVTNREYNPTVEVSNVSHPALTGERAHVGLYASGKARAADVDSSSTTFTDTSVTFGEEVDISMVVPGMIVDIDPPSVGAPVNGCGVVTGVSKRTVSVDGWFVNVGGTPTRTTTPNSGTRIVINFTRKVWGAHYEIYKTAFRGNLNAQISLAEADIFTDNDDSQSVLDANGVYSWGWDVTMLGTGHATALYLARGGLKTQFGYLSTGISRNAAGNGGEWSAHYMAAQAYGQTGGTTQAAFLDDASNATTGFRANGIRSKMLLGGYLDHGNTTRRLFSVNIEGDHEWSETAAASPDVVLQNEAVAGVGTGNLHVSTGGFKVGTTAPLRLTSGGAVEFTKRADTGAAASSKAFWYLRDSPTTPGKGQLVVQFPTGSPIILATEA